MLSVSTVVGRMCFVYVFNDVSDLFAVDGWLNNVTRSVILQAFIHKCTDCVPVSDRLYLAFIQLLKCSSKCAILVLIIVVFAL